MSMSTKSRGQNIPIWKENMHYSHRWHLALIEASVFQNLTLISGACQLTLNAGLVGFLSNTLIPCAW